MRALVCLLGLVFLLAGCGTERALDADLYRGDGLLQTVQRFFFPDTYWRHKKERLQEQIQKSRALFRVQTQAYRVLLKKRRGEVMQAMSQARASGAEPHTARREVIQTLRSAVDAQRERARQQGKALRHAMALLVQAEAASVRPGWWVL